MTNAFHCPDCGSSHDEPAEAAFVLAVRCLDCDLLALLASRSRAPRERRPFRAAA